VWEELMQVELKRISSALYEKLIDIKMYGYSEEQMEAVLDILELLDKKLNEDEKA
jgi:uncharacterized protein YlaN (UPF0358 family)